MTQGVVQHGALAQRPQVHHEVLLRAVGPVVFDEAAGIALPLGVEQRLERVDVGVFADVQLVVGLERFDPGDEPVVGVRQLDEVGLDRRMRHELRAERVGPQWEDPRCVDSVRRADVECRVRAVQGDPSTATLRPNS